MLHTCLKFYGAYLMYVSYVLCQDKEWPLHSYQYGLGHGNREELVITDVISDNDFNLENNISMWKTIAAGSANYAVGETIDGFVILKLKANATLKKFNVEWRQEFQVSSKAFELFSRWNSDLRITEVILCIATPGNSPKLKFYTLQKDNLDLIWSWPVDTILSHIFYFKLEDNVNRLLLLLNEKDNYDARMYEFTFDSSKKNHYWLAQTVPLSNPAFTTAINTFGSEVYLSICQVDTILVFKFDNNRFTPYQNISSEGVSHLSAFTIGFKSFLAVSGKNAAIYRFAHKGIAVEDINDNNLDYVDYWLPISVKTYRNEVILFSQRLVNHTSHQSYHLETFVYDGRHFLRHDEVSCTYYDETETGLSCLVDEEGESGLKGAAVFPANNFTGILVPQSRGSQFFIMNSQVRELLRPAELQEQKLKATRERLQRKIDIQQARMLIIQERLENSIKLDEPNTVSANWRVNSVSAPAVGHNMELPPISENHRLEEVDIEELETQLDNIQKGIIDAKLKLQNAVKLNQIDNDFDELIINGNIEVLGESTFKSVQTAIFNNELVHDAFNDIVRSSNVNAFSGHKTFFNLKVNNLQADFINDVDVSLISVDPSDLIVIEGDVEFINPIQINGNTIINGTVNGINLFDELVETTKPYNGTLTFETIQADAVTAANFPIELNFDRGRGDIASHGIPELQIDEFVFPGNITVGYINGQNFDEFVNSLRYVKLETHIPYNVTIEGSLHVTESLKFNNLNDLKFPEEFVLTNSEATVITGKKIFEGPIIVNEVITPGTVNGVPTEDIITLSTNQSIPATVTFSDLEVTETFNVTGNIIAQGVDLSIDNRPLSETHEIKGNVNFKALEVEGDIILSGDLNGVDFGEILSDVVYKDEEEAIITAVKTFPVGLSVTNGIQVDSDAINSYPLELFVTKDTEQTLVFSTLNGPVVFENLYISGLYDNIDITKLDEEAVKLTGEQFISSQLIFATEDNTLVGLTATDVVIEKTLNKIYTQDYVSKSGDSRSLPNHLHFTTLNAKNIFIEGGLSGEINDFDVKKFDERRLSYTRDQSITGAYTIRSLEADTLEANLINGQPFDKYFKYEFYSDEISRMLFDGELQIKNLHVNGSVFAGELNEYDMKAIMENRQFDNDRTETAIFYKNVSVDNIALVNFNGVNLQKTLDNIIYKTNGDLVINSFKTFINGFRVSHMLNAEFINDIHVDNILVKSGIQTLSGPIHIYGDVVIESDCEVKENLNNISIAQVGQKYQFTENSCIINDDVVINNLAYVNQLIIEGYANGKLTDKFLSSLVYKNEDAEILGKVIFQKPVYIKQNLIIGETLNGVEFTDYVDDMVFVTKDDIIESSLIFTAPVDVAEELLVENNLNARYLRGVDLRSWNERAVFINKGIIPGCVTFEAVTVHDNMFLNYLNDIDLNTLIPLNSDKYVNETVDFYEVSVFNDVPVGNYVNGYNLYMEYPNTLFKSGDIQNMRQKLNFHGNFSVGKNLDVQGFVNNKNLSEIVTTNTDQILTAAYDFLGNITMQSKFLVDGLVEDVDVEYWRNRSVRSDAEHTQTIENLWTIEGNVTFIEEVKGESLMKGLNLKTLEEEIEQKRVHRTTAEIEILENYHDMCQDLNVLREKSENQVYLFRYLESYQSIEFNEDINVMYNFHYETRSYIWISIRNSCISFLYVWTENKFHLLTKLETGSVSQIIAVFDGELLFFVVRNDKNTINCDIEETNVWIFKSGNLKLLYRLEDQDLLEESILPKTFYGLKGNVVTEYKIITAAATNIVKYRKWMIKKGSESLRFLPRGLNIGLALTDGRKIWTLLRNNSANKIDIKIDIEEIIMAVVVERDNYWLTAESQEVIAVNVGMEENKQILIAVSYQEEASVKSNTDFVKIYEDILTGKVFQKLSTFKPSSLLSLEFNNSGETVLVLLEDKKVLKLFEYKGLEGFKHRVSAKVDATKVLELSVPSIGLQDKKLLALIFENQVTIVEVVTAGNRIKMEEHPCLL